MNNYKTYFIQTYPDGDGVTLYTDTRWTIRLEDMFINPNTDILLIRYLNNKNELKYCSTTCEDFSFISIEEKAKDENMQIL